MLDVCDKEFGEMMVGIIQQRVQSWNLGNETSKTTSLRAAGIVTTIGFGAYGMELRAKRFV